MNETYNVGDVVVVCQQLTPIGAHGVVRARPTGPGFPYSVRIIRPPKSPISIWAYPGEIVGRLDPAVARLLYGDLP